MSGFNPLSELKDWHIKLGCALVIVGAIALVVCIIKSIVWVINHVQII